MTGEVKKWPVKRHFWPVIVRWPAVILSPVISFHFLFFSLPVGFISLSGPRLLPDDDQTLVQERPRAGRVQIRSLQTSSSKRDREKTTTSAPSSPHNPRSRWTGRWNQRVIDAFDPLKEENGRNDRMRFLVSWSSGRARGTSRSKAKSWNETKRIEPNMKSWIYRRDQQMSARQAFEALLCHFCCKKK